MQEITGWVGVLFLVYSSVFFDSLAPARLALRANLRLLYLKGPAFSVVVNLLIRSGRVYLLRLKILLILLIDSLRSPFGQTWFVALRFASVLSKSSC